MLKFIFWMNTQIWWPLCPLLPEPQPFFHSYNSCWTQPFTKSICPLHSKTLDSLTRHFIDSQTLKFHYLDLYSRLDVTFWNKRVDLFIGLCWLSDSWENGSVLEHCTLNSFNWHCVRHWESLDLIRISEKLHDAHHCTIHNFICLIKHLSLLLCFSFLVPQLRS